MIKTKQINKKQVLQTIRRHLQDHFPEIIFSYVFGSFLRNEKYADIDIGIYVKEDLNNILDYELSLEVEIGDLVHYPVDVRTLNSAPLSFNYGVIHDGNVIIDRKPTLRSDFEIRILKEYFDFSPFRQHYLEDVQNAPI